MAPGEEDDAAVLPAAQSRWRERARGTKRLGVDEKSPIWGPSKKNSSKLNERPRNVYENKGPLWKNAGLSWYVSENTVT
jgi:hypothetical protein